MTDRTAPPPADLDRSSQQAARDARGRETRRVSLVTGSVNLLLSITQVVVGLIANSAALIADGIHSASDLVSDVMVWFAARHAAQAPDADHPYGHGRFETAATLGLGLLLVGVALGIVWNGGERLLDPQRPIPGTIALVVAALGIVAKESLYWYTIAVAKRLKSELLRANAWHHRSDAISSVVVLIGVGGAVMGFSYMDALAAIVVGLMVAKIGWDLGWSALSELVDTALEEDAVDHARRVIMGVDGVRSVHMLRTRRHGAEASADVHVQVAPRLSVSEGHMISQAVEDRVISQVADITDVTVHIDPEDDEDTPSCRDLPLRAAALGAIESAWEGAHIIPGQREIRLHYLSGQIDVELILPLASYTDSAASDALRARLAAALEPLDWFGGLRLLYS
ncbi:MAG: cation diffusion facilitator family transporter [Gammaproteobacteria bacterium]|nr:cation diffusion facilitator family transporter [Gammaproteobacteria bacterium]